MSSVNKAILIGRLGKDPDTRYLPDGTAVTTVSIATSERWKDKNGEKQDRTEWHRVIFYKKLAEIVQEFLVKGSMLYVEGRLRTQKWTDKNNVDRYTTEIIATNMAMLGGGKQPENQGNQNQPQPPAGNGFDDMQDDITF